MYSVIMVAMIIAIAVGAGACPMNLTLVFLLFILSIHIIAGLGIDSFCYRISIDLTNIRTIITYEII